MKRSALAQVTWYTWRGLCYLPAPQSNHLLPSRTFHSQYLFQFVIEQLLLCLFSDCFDSNISSVRTKTIFLLFTAIYIISSTIEDTEVIE